MPEPHNAVSFNQCRRDWKAKSKDWLPITDLNAFAVRYSLVMAEYPHMSQLEALDLLILSEANKVNKRRKAGGRHG